tara:strand:- start:1359 stop:1487 length:129 start_codon:yes stop_codon:yes gene_type:complete
MDKKTLKVISSELKKASKMHKSQAARIDRMIKKVNSSVKKKK